NTRRLVSAATSLFASSGYRRSTINSPFEGSCRSLGSQAIRRVSRKETSMRFRNFGWLSADDVVRLILSFALMALVARYLGTGDYGALSYIFGVVGLLAPLTAVGLDVVTLRRL